MNRTIVQQEIDMSFNLPDVDPRTTTMLIEHWRTTPVWQKLAYVDELNEILKTIALSDLRRRHPTESYAQLQRRLAARWLGTELAERIYGPINEADCAAH